MVELRGFLITVFCPTESKLEVEVDASHIPWEKYKSLIEELEDILNDIDREYSVKSELVRGRSLRARYRRITTESRSKKLKFSPFPSCYQNVLKNVRAYVYALVNRYCFVIEQIGNRKLYLLPKDKAPAFIESIEKLNEDVIKELREKIEKFMKTNEFFQIAQCLSKYGIDPSIITGKSFTISNYYVDVLPIDFSYDVGADEYFKKPELVRGAELLRKMIEKKHKEYVRRIVEDVIARIEPMIRSGLKNVRMKKLNELIELCNSVGLKNVVDKVLEPIKRILEQKPDKRKALIEKEFGSNPIEEIRRRLMQE